MSAWKNIPPKIDVVNFAEIMNKQYIDRLKKTDDYKPTVCKDKEGTQSAEESISFEFEEYSYDSDLVIAQLLQSQFDHEYNEELRRIEKQRNKDSKVTVTLEKYMRHIETQIFDSEDEAIDDGECESQRRDWDRFETNERVAETIPKCGYKIDKDGEMITKHDAQLCGIRNACRVMSFPPEFPTGDGAGFNMHLSNQVFNQLKTYSQRGKKKPKMYYRNDNKATAEMGIDATTRLLLFKLINNQVLEQINGIVSTGKEAVILHAYSDATYGIKNNHQNYNQGFLPRNVIPKECVVKIFKTSIKEFKQRDRYIKDDYRFKDRFNKQNNRVIINLWAEKEMRNLIRMQSVGINCPHVVVLKKHVLIMSFIGSNHNAAPKLKDAILSQADLQLAYEDVTQTMQKLYNEAKLVHADLSEYNILWYNKKCCFIDVAQSVEPDHPSALEFLMRDCDNIVNFFEKKGLLNILTKEKLFKLITNLDAEMHTTAMLERIEKRDSTFKKLRVLQPENDANTSESYPFDVVWEKSKLNLTQEQSLQKKIDKASCVLDVLTIN